MMQPDSHFIPDPDAVLERVRAICAEGADMVRAQEEPNTAHRKGYGDVATHTDLAVQQRLIERLDGLVPGALFHCEEEGVRQSRSGLYWSIDPIDGTNNFIYGLWPHSVSVGLWNGEEPILGVVHEVPSGISYFGTTIAAFMQPSGGNPEPIQVSDNRIAEDAMICFGLARMADNESIISGTIARLQAHFRSTRKLGCTSMEIVLVARGSTDGYLGLNVSHWDVGGAIPILLGAGGRITLPDGSPWRGEGRILCSNGILHDELASMMSV